MITNSHLFILSYWNNEDFSAGVKILFWCALSRHSVAEENVQRPLERIRLLRNTGSVDQRKNNQPSVLRKQKQHTVSRSYHSSQKTQILISPDPQNPQNMEPWTELDELLGRIKKLNQIKCEDLQLSKCLHEATWFYKKSWVAGFATKVKPKRFLSVLATTTKKVKLRSGVGSVANFLEAPAPWEAIYGCCFRIYELVSMIWHIIFNVWEGSKNFPFESMAIASSL